MANEIVGQILMVIGAILITIGVIGMYKYKHFFTRASIASLIDTAGFITVVVGIMFYKGVSLFTLKLGIIIFFMILLNPLATHIIVRGAYSSGLDTTKKK